MLSPGPPPGQGRGPGALGFSLHLARVGFGGPRRERNTCSQQEACLRPALRSRSSWGGGVHQGRRGDYSRRSPCAAGHQRPGPRWGRADDGGPSSEGWLCTAVGRGQQGGPRRPEGTANWRGGRTSHRGVREGARASCKILLPQSDV